MQYDPLIFDHAGRLGRLQETLAEAGLAGAVIFHSRDVFYYTGCAAPGWLLVRADDWRLAAPRAPWRAREDLAFAGLEHGRVLEGLGLNEACARFFPGQGAGESVALELDLLSVLEAGRFQAALGARQMVDATPIIMAQRMLKEPAEIAALERACLAVAAGHQALQAATRPGASELELAAACENAQRLAGHDGVFFLRQPDVLMGRGPLASGPNLNHMSGTVFTVTGRGLHRAMPSGPSRRRLESGDLLLADVPACVDGYHADQTRMYACGQPSARAVELAEAVRAISDRVIAGLRPGLTCHEAFQSALDAAADLGLSAEFLAFDHGPSAHFIGHGLGLELNEPPVVKRGNPAPLRAGMVLALEMHLNAGPGLVLKIEDSVHLGPEGARLLTTSPRGLNLAGRG